MALYGNPTSYSDFLNRLQSYSASRRAATGRGLSPEELQGMTSGYLEAENARKADAYKTAMQAKAQRDSLASQQAIANREYDLKKDTLSQQNQQGIGQGIAGAGSKLGELYVMNKFADKQPGDNVLTDAITKLWKSRTPTGTSTPTVNPTSTPTSGVLSSDIYQDVYKDINPFSSVSDTSWPTTMGPGAGEILPDAMSVLSNPQSALEVAPEFLDAANGVGYAAPQAVSEGILSSLGSYMPAVGAGTTGGSLGATGMRELDLMGKNESDALGGAAGGAAAGAAAGSVVPGIGTGVGAIVGGISGLLSQLFQDGFFEF